MATTLNNSLLDEFRAFVDGNSGDGTMLQRQGQSAQAHGQREKVSS